MKEKQKARDSKPLIASKEVTTNEKDTSWVINRKDKQGGFNFFSKPIVINASVDKVWGLAKNVERYEEFSNHAIKAHVDGPLEVGKKIAFDLYNNEVLGNFIPHSDETITEVNEQEHIVAWERKLPCTKNPTERYGIFKQSEENPNQTIAYTGLHVPGGIGFFTKIFLGSKIEQAFDQLNEGIKEEAERMTFSQ